MNPPIKRNRDMLGPADIVSLKETLLLLQQNLPPSPDRKAIFPLDEALGRICTADILSPENLAPFQRSIMDGYAGMARDTFGASEKLPAYLEVSGEVFMGEFPTQDSQPGVCFAIATGGIISTGDEIISCSERKTG
jgi:molybdopterin molybdotransferase